MRHRFACSLFMEKKEYEIVTYEAMANLSACLMMFGNGCIAQPRVCNYAWLPSFVLADMYPADETDQSIRHVD